MGKKKKDMGPVEVLLPLTQYNKDVLALSQQIAARLARQVYPGPVGELISRELLAWEPPYDWLTLDQLADLLHTAMMSIIDQHVTTAQMARALEAEAR